MSETTTATATAPTATDSGETDTGAADVTTLLARLAQVTDQLATTIPTNCDSDGGAGVGMRTAGAILAATDRLTATVITVLGSLSHRGVIADEGITAAAWLRTFAARTAADERMLANTADRLADMPTIRGWFSSGELSWPAVRGIITAVRNLTPQQRRWVDDTIAADPDRVSRLDADDTVAAVTALADRARPDLHRDRERRGVQRDRVYCQDGFDGSSYGSWELSPESAERFRRALFDTHPTTTTNPADTDRDDGNGGHDPAGNDRDSDPHITDDHPGDATDRHASIYSDHNADSSHDDRDGHDGDDGTVDGADDEFTGLDRWRHRRAWTNAQALLALCNQRLGEPGGSAPSTARPSMLAIVDIDALTTTRDGVGSATAQLFTRTARGPIELTPAAAQRLACDATLRYVLVDGAIPLGVTAAEPKVSVTLRAALIARDGGCRFPACHQPVDVCENHHVIPKAQGGPTTLDNLVLLCLAHHHAVHDSGWANRLHLDGTVTFTRRGVTITSLPRRDRRFTPSRPPPTGRPTRPHPTTNSSSSGDRTAGDPPRPADHAAAADPDPPPDDNLPFKKKGTTHKAVIPDNRARTHRARTHPCPQPGSTPVPPNRGRRAPPMTAARQALSSPSHGPRARPTSARATGHGFEAQNRRSHAGTPVCPTSVRAAPR
jgi:hypothetical protein